VSGVPEGKEQFKEFMRRVRRAVGGNDKAASHATRLAGTENWKLKYLPDVPTVRILEAHPGRIVTPVQLSELGLLMAPAPVQSSSSVVHLDAYREKVSDGHERQWPVYDHYLRSARLKEDGSPDRSEADFSWAKNAAKRGWSIKETEEMLLEVSPKAKDRARSGDEGYARVTAENAAVAAKQGRRLGRG
jgi:hypothetical protein